MPCGRWSGRGSPCWPLTPAADAEPIADVAEALGPLGRRTAASATDAGPTRLALVVGAEGPGLTGAAMDAATRRVRIPTAPGVDSLNVATAAAVALHALTGSRFS